MRKGLLVVYTGDGKGKTTAALGTALRALGHGCRVCLVQFVKGPWISGEIKALSRFSEQVAVHSLGKGFIYTEEDVERDREDSVQAWRFARQLLGSSAFDVVILDELTYLMSFGMVDEAEVIRALAARPPSMHVIVTGRGASPALVEAADLVTEMREVRHPMNGGITCQEGIEF